MFFLGPGDGGVAPEAGHDVCEIFSHRPSQEGPGGAKGSKQTLQMWAVVAYSWSHSSRETSLIIAKVRGRGSFKEKLLPL